MEKAKHPPAFQLYQSGIEPANQGVFAYQAHSQPCLYLNPAFQPVTGSSPATSSRARGLPTVAGRANQREGELRWRLVKPDLIPVSYQESRWGGILEEMTQWKGYREVETCHSNKNAILQTLSHDLAGCQIQVLSAIIANDRKQPGHEPLNTVRGLITQTSKRNIRLIRDFPEEQFLESTEMPLLASRVKETTTQQVDIASQGCAG
jgi:hypothetical protein